MAERRQGRKGASPGAREGQAARRSGKAAVARMQDSQALYNGRTVIYFDTDQVLFS